MIARASQLFLPTLRDDPADADATGPSHCNASSFAIQNR